MRTAVLKCKSSRWNNLIRLFPLFHKTRLCKYASVVNGREFLRIALAPLQAKVITSLIRLCARRITGLGISRSPPGVSRAFAIFRFAETGVSDDFFRGRVSTPQFAAVS